MKNRRRRIVEILKERGSATVDELSQALGITTVTVRHHLDVLRSQGLVSEPEVRHRARAGRPQHSYALTDKASELFPKNFDGLAAQLLDEVKARLEVRHVNVIFEGVASRLVADAPRPRAGESMEKRLDRAVAFLNDKGYVARWEREVRGYVVHTCNCPYEGLAAEHPELCSVDMTLVAALTGVKPERVCHMTDGGESCSYLVMEAPPLRHNL